MGASSSKQKRRRAEQARNSDLHPHPQPVYRRSCRRSYYEPARDGSGRWEAYETPKTASVPRTVRRDKGKKRAR